jgi:SAM-dependent methyltransferase
MKTNWGHGYHSSGQYTYGFYPETAPAWLDFAALFQGHLPARTAGNSNFRYLELGCGMGFGLCLLAAAYPEGEFLGLDFHPDHVVQASTLAQNLGLENILFLEADLIDLAKPTPGVDHGLGEANSWDYVVAHGVISWVTEPVRESLMRVFASTVKLGGIIYCSYNCNPGWYAGDIFRQVARLEMDYGQTANSHSAFQRARERLLTIMGEPGTPMPLAMHCPPLRGLLNRVPAEQPDYLHQEYGPAGWQPLWSSDFHNLSREHKLEPIGTATLSEMLEQLLLPQLHDAVLREADPAMKSCLLDVATCKSFRRDLLVRGRRRGATSELNARLSAIEIRLQEPSPKDGYLFETVFGDVQADIMACRAIEDKLSDGPMSLGELAKSFGKSMTELLRYVPLLLENGRLGFARTDQAIQQADNVSHANRRLMERTAAGHPYGFLSAPRVGSAVPFGLIDVLLLKHREQGKRGSDLSQAVLEDIQALGQTIGDSDGRTLQGETIQRDAIERSDKLLSRRLGWLRDMGCI